MQDNQNKQQSGQQGGAKPQQQLSWSQQSATGQKEPQKNQTPPARGSVVPGNPASAPKSRVAFTFVIGLIIGWLVTWSWFDLRSSSSPSVSSNATSTSEASGTSAITVTQSGASQESPSTAASTTAVTGPETVASGQVSSDTVAVPSPQNAGTSVIVSNLMANDAVWAAVYENTDGKPGRILGAARFAAGKTSGTIELLRSTLPNLNYYVGLLADTPDHTFGVRTNAPLLDQSGQQIMTPFTAK